MDQLLIREATQNDISRVIQLQKLLIKEDLIYGFTPESERELIKKIGNYFLVTEVGGDIIGFIYGQVLKSEGLATIPQGEQYLEIEEIYIKPEFRNQGVGGKLLDRVVEEAKKNGVEKFSIYSASKDIDGILNFYRKHDFKPWFIQMVKTR